MPTNATTRARPLIHRGLKPVQKKQRSWGSNCPHTWIPETSEPIAEYEHSTQGAVRVKRERAIAGQSGLQSLSDQPKLHGSGFLSHSETSFFPGVRRSLLPKRPKESFRSPMSRNVTERSAEMRTKSDFLARVHVGQNRPESRPQRERGTVFWSKAVTTNQLQVAPNSNSRDLELRTTKKRRTRRPQEFQTTAKRQPGAPKTTRTNTKLPPTSRKRTLPQSQDF